MRLTCVHCGKRISPDKPAIEVQYGERRHLIGLMHYRCLADFKGNKIEEEFAVRSQEGFDAFNAQVERNIARGSLSDNIPPDIEEAAIQLLEQESEAVCGVRWVWHDMADELRNRYRLWAFVNAYRANAPTSKD